MFTPHSTTVDSKGGSSVAGLDETKLLSLYGMRQNATHTEIPDNYKWWKLNPAQLLLFDELQSRLGAKTPASALGTASKESDACNLPEPPLPTISLPGAGASEDDASAKTLAGMALFAASSAAALYAQLRTPPSTPPASEPPNPHKAARASNSPEARADTHAVGATARGKVSDSKRVRATAPTTHRLTRPNPVTSHTLWNIIDTHHNLRRIKILRNSKTHANFRHPPRGRSISTRS